MDGREKKRRGGGKLRNYELPLRAPSGSEPRVDPESRGGEKVRVGLGGQSDTKGEGRLKLNFYR